MGAMVSACVWQYADIRYGFLDQELGFDNLHALAAQGRHKTVRKLLRHGMDPNARRMEGALGADDDERGDSPMICATRGDLGNKDQQRHVNTLEVLLHFGAKVNQPNLLNQTPLYVACERNLLRVATWLLQHGADVNINCKNQNETLAIMLLEKGAVVIRPPTTFSHIKVALLCFAFSFDRSAYRRLKKKFPELSDELDNDEASANDKQAAKLHSSLQQFVDREAERREGLLKAAHEAQRLEDQRIYREQLAKEGSKRKARRRRKRLEAQQRRNLPPVNAASDIDRDEEYLRNGDKNTSMPGRVSEHHQEELSKFLKFFRSRLKTHLENVEADFEDTRSDRLSSEEVYSQKDIQEAITSLCFAVKANIRSELQDTINMMALLLRQIFIEAEDSNLALDLDIAMVEDKELLERVEQLSVSEWTSGDSSSAAQIGAMPKSKAKVQVDAEAKDKLEKQLQHEQEQHEEEIRAAKLTSKREQEALEAAHAKELRKLQRKLEQANDRVEELEKQVEDGRQHVAQTAQFQSMKRMVTTKNQQLQDLRRRLQRYEPDYAEDDGETKDADDD
ncbi:Sterol 3-beta-glucosyltransferase [Phytophthora nicotianae]|nr:Sterol 3-beta-glucosyltransferase [Phytophthora nicotianae]